MYMENTITLLELLQPDYVYGLGRWLREVDGM